MEEREEALKILQYAAIRTFCKIPSDLNDPKTVGAIISAASNMAIASDDELDYHMEPTREALLEAFDVENNPNIAEFSEMAPQYVKPLIGYSVDFKDYGAARAEYESDKDSYNMVFGQAKYIYNTKTKKTL